MTTEEKIKRVIAEQLEIDVSKVVPEASIEYDLHADSLDMVQIVMAVEEDCEVEIPDEEAVNLFTVADVIRFVENYYKDESKQDESKKGESNQENKKC